MIKRARVKSDPSEFQCGAVAPSADEKDIPAGGAAGPQARVHEHGTRQHRIHNGVR